MVAPTRAALGDRGIALRSGRSLPFRVARAWNAPAGYYREAWYLVHPETREVLFEGPSRQVRIWGLQSWEEFSDVVDAGFALEPGTYLVVFGLGGLLGGQIEVEAWEAPQEEAA